MITHHETGAFLLFALFTLGFYEAWVAWAAGGITARLFFRHLAGYYPELRLAYVLLAVTLYWYLFEGARP